MQPSPELLKNPKYHFLKIFAVTLCVVALLAIFILPMGVGSRPSRNPTVGEIVSLAAALESYKVDHGNYPSDPKSTERLASNFAFDPDSYIPSSEFLYAALSGRLNPDDKTVYYAFSIKQIKTSPEGRTHIVDEWGDSIGYSTLEALHPGNRGGNNPTYDLWSMGGGKQAESIQLDIKLAEPVISPEQVAGFHQFTPRRLH